MEVSEPDVQAAVTAARLRCHACHECCLWRPPPESQQYRLAGSADQPLPEGSSRLLPCQLCCGLSCCRACSSHDVECVASKPPGGRQVCRSLHHAVLARKADLTAAGGQ